MTDLALKHYTPGSLPTVEAVPVTQLTPMQMAYQLVAKGADFAAVREMIEFGKKLEADEAEKAFNIAMAEAQAEMRPIAADAENPQTRSKYASYAALDRALRPTYTKHGFALSFDEGDTEKPDHIRVLCYVTHRAGHARTYRKDMPSDGKGARGGDVMSKTHAAGAADSYGMRYLMRKIFNVAVGADDKDGNAPRDAAPSATITEAQVKELLALIEEAKTTTDKFCEITKVDAVPDLPADQFQLAKTMLHSRLAKVRARTKADPNAQFDAMERGDA
jgi:hypothetical protein